MELIPGITKEDHTNYLLYYIECISPSLKDEIRNSLVSICHGKAHADSTSQVYSYNATVKEFIRRYKGNKLSEDRKIGMIGELLVHVILKIENRFVTASPFFNMEERSFKKGFDITLFDSKTSEIWITEIKSGEKRKKQKNPSVAIVCLINSAKGDLKRRINNRNISLWLNAINSANASMSNSSNQKDAIIKLLEKYADDAEGGYANLNQYNVILSGVLFHSISERIDRDSIQKKYSRVVRENLFNKTLIMAIQNESYHAVYSFLESEANNEI